jgi:hypothetical protein
MNSITKLAAAALGALSIAGGVAVAQDNSTNNDARSDTANYGTPPGAPLKRDGSLSADPTPTATMSAPVTTDTTSSGTTTTTTTTNTTTAAPVADTSSTAPAADASTSNAGASLQPRADRN